MGKQSFENKSGIYKIINLVNGKLYIGSAINLDNRKRSHFCDLKNNRHGNSYLQNAWNKYGDENFEFSLIEYVDNINDLIKHEQYWIDSLNVCDRNVGYNINPTAGSNLGKTFSDEVRKNMSDSKKGKKLTDEQIKSLNEARVKSGYSESFRSKLREARTGSKLSDETKQKISESHKNDKHYNYGKHLKLSTRIKISESQMGEKSYKAKLNNNDVVSIKKLIIAGISNIEIANMFNISKQTISQIRVGNTWKNVYVEGFNIEIKKGSAKLTEKNVLDIKQLLMQGLSNKDIAKIYNVHKSTIEKINNGKSWKNIKIDNNAS